MSKLADIVAAMRVNPKGVRFSDLERVCCEFFGQPKRSSGSHRVYKMPWAGDPRVNIQDINGEAKPYQVRQVLTAIDKLNEDEK